MEIREGGNPVTLPTPGGPIIVPTISVLAQVVPGVPAPVGHDSGYSANGDVLVHAAIQSYSTTAMRVHKRAARWDIILAEGFE